MEFSDHCRRIQIVSEGAAHSLRHFMCRRQPLQLAVPIPERFMRFVEAFEGPVQWLAVMCTKHIETQRITRPSIPMPLRQQIANRDEIAEALRHLRALDL